MTKTRIYGPVCRHYFAGKHDWATNNDTASNHHSLNSNFPVNVYGVLSFLYLNRISTKWFKDVRSRFLTIAAIAVIGIMTTSCQLLIDNRKSGKTSVVVVPTDEWDMLRGQQMQPNIARDIAKDMAAGIIDELRSTPSTIAAATPAEDMPADNAIMPVKPPAPTPIDGSQTIQFSNRTNSQLAGCSSIGIIEVLHTGTIDDALIILKNEAYRLNTNILVPLSMNQTDADPIASPNIQIEARMMKCPLKLARGN